MLLAGDFNCVLNAAESTGRTQPCRALALSYAALTTGKCGMCPDQVFYTPITPQNRRPDWTGSRLLEGCSSVSEELRQWHQLLQMT